MKKVLIADSHAQFREFLKQKLTEVQTEVIATSEKRELQTKAITSLPNLIILDMPDDDTYEFGFLEKKIQDSNTAGIPVIITGSKRDPANIAPLTKYGVIKYFEKPVKLDVFFNAINKTLHTSIIMDDTPCILDLHRNSNIIFIEVAMGLNRDKIALMQFKLTEMIEKEKMDSPKVVVMLTSLDLTFVDGYNLEFLIENIISCPKIQRKNVKILSTSDFVKAFVDGHQEYNGLEVASNLSHLLNTLVGGGHSTDVSDIITDQILIADEEFDEEGGSLATKFTSDELFADVAKEDGTLLKIAIIDSDEQALELEKQIFESIGANVSCFSRGATFIKEYEDEKYNLILLDILIADKTGISLLSFIKKRPYGPPVIVYSASKQKEIIQRVMEMGANNYILKPQKPAVLVKKTLSVLHFSE